MRKALQKWLKLKAFQQKLCLANGFQTQHLNTLACCAKNANDEPSCKFEPKEFHAQKLRFKCAKFRKSNITQAHQTRSDMHTQQTVYNVLFILY